ncbi:MAG: alpha/beta hydrolase [Deltaproteobacteria bacterium]|nr:alpha/beta hydrolase [Deltaproteobacteria bacterium]
MPGVQRERFGDFSVLRREPSGAETVTVHFAHATGFNAETYAMLLEGLDASIAAYLMDARGHGRSTATAKPKKLNSWRPYRDDLEAFVETLPQPVVLGGHSMGATVSMELAAARPDLVGGLVLVDPVIVPPAHIPMLAAARTLGLTERIVPIARMAARRRMEFPSKRAAVENYVGKGPFRTWPQEWIEAYVEGGTVENDDGTVRLSCDRAWESRTFAMATVNPYRALRKVRCPITLFAREHSGPPFTRASRNAFMRCRPETRLLVLEDVTHFMAMERPDVVVEELGRTAERVRSELG